MKMNPSFAFIIAIMSISIVTSTSWTKPFIDKIPPFLLGVVITGIIIVLTIKCIRSIEANAVKNADGIRVRDLCHAKIGKNLDFEIIGKLPDGSAIIKLSDKEKLNDPPEYFKHPLNLEVGKKGSCQVYKIFHDGKYPSYDLHFI